MSTTTIPTKGRTNNSKIIMIVNGENVAEVENHKDEHQQKFLEEEEPTLQCEICERRSGACSSKQNNRYHHDSNQSTTSTTEDSTLVGSATSVASRLDYGQVNSSSHPLFWPGKDVRLYDRENQLNSLRKAYKRRKTAARNGLPEIVLITGQSGTGKSALAYSLRETVQGDGGFFIHGKFDQLRQPSRPFATLADAFQRLVQLIERRGDTDVEAIREEARTAVGPEAALLTETFPCLRELLDVKKKSAKQSDAISESGAISDQKQIALVFRRFIKAIASPDRPLVLFIDDLQWADTASLDLLRSLWKGSTATCTRTQEIQQQQDQNTDIPGLMLLFTARGHEIAFDSYLSKLLRIMEDNGTGTITEIQVGNLRKKALRDMLSDILGVPTQDCTSLAEIVYQRSNKGQIFHAMRYLEKLQEDGYLVHDEDSGVWSWNEEKITRITKEESSIDDLTNDSLAMLLEQKTKQMPPPTQDILKVASCLGGEFSLDILCKAANLPLLGGIDAFKVGCELGFVAFKSNKKSGYFIHDKFQEAAYAMIPDQLKPAFQLQVARNLGANLTQEEFESNLLLIVNLGIFGSEVIDADECRLKLSELCLTAGRKAARSSAFSTAVHYFETGIKMLKGNYWETHYQLSLELHTAASEMAYCMGNHQKVDVFSFEIDRNALCLNDKLAAKSTQIMSMFSMERYEEALQLGFGVSKDLGEKFPSKVGTFGLFMDFMKTKRVLKGKTDADILSLLPMTDTGAIAVMSIIHLLYGLLVRSKFELAPLIGFRMVRLTMRYGLSPISKLEWSYAAPDSEIFHRQSLSFYPFPHLMICLFSCSLLQAALVLVYTPPSMVGWGWWRKLPDTVI